MAGGVFEEACADLVGSMTLLQNLNLNECKIGDAGGESVFLWLSSNTSLHTLTLQNNLLRVHILSQHFCRSELL